MIRDTQIGSKTNPYKETSVILHCYTLSRNTTKREWDYSEDVNPDPNDGKRHRIRSFIIAHDDNPYPNIAVLKNLLAVSITNHSNIKNSLDYGSKLGGFCSTCLANVKSECKKKFGGNW